MKSFAEIERDFKTSLTAAIQIAESHRGRGECEIGGVRYLVSWGVAIDHSDMSVDFDLDTIAVNPEEVVPKGGPIPKALMEAHDAGYECLRLWHAGSAAFPATPAELFGLEEAGQ